MENISGKILKIDLNTRVTEAIDLGKDVYVKYLGGRGLGSWILYHWLEKGTKPLEPKNWLLFLVGPVTGTLVPTAIKYVVITKSPLTGAWLDSYSSGRIAWEIKKAGWDGLAIVGRSLEPCCIWIKDNHVEFRDASKLWGKGCFETESCLLKESKDAGTLVIGPAAENGVKFAGIRSDSYRCAGRGGAGTVLASKNVKAIAIEGTKDIRCSNLEALQDKIRQLVQKAKNSNSALALRTYGTAMTLSVTNEAGMLPTNNFQFGEFEKATGSIDGEAVLRRKVRTKGCHSCIMPCGQITRDKTGQLIKSPEYETLALLGSNIGIADLDFVTEANHLCDDLGMDTISTGGVIGFAMECFQRGILTKTDTHGLDLTFGNKDAALILIEDIGFRRGLGQILSEGVKVAAQYLGGDAFRYAMHVKGMELPGYDPRGAFGSYLSYSVNPRGGCHRRAWPPKFEVLGNVPPYMWEGKASLIKSMFDERIILHSLLVCDLPANFLNISLDEYVSMLNDVTGGRFTVEMLRKLADRVETQIRLFNCQEGFSKKDDILPLRFYEEAFQKGAPKGHILDKHHFELMLEEYSSLRGWDKEGYPKEEILDNLEITRL